MVPWQTVGPTLLCAAPHTLPVILTNKSYISVEGDSCFRHEADWVQAEGEFEIILFRKYYCVYLCAYIHVPAGVSQKRVLGNLVGEVSHSK